jgi:ribonuclease III
MLTLERKKQLTRFLEKYRLPMMSDLELLDRALTHSSYAFEMQLSYDNERLEFLGDSVLGLVVSEFLFNEFPKAREGVLSKHKSQIISRGILGKRAQEMDIGKLMLLGRGEELHGGRDRPVLLGSALEALVGALYLDFGIKPMRDFLYQEIFNPARVLSTTDEFGDYKSMLQEFVQKQFQTVPEYVIIEESGPDHSKHFIVEVRINGNSAGRGEGSRKKIAENQAAMRAYWNLTQADSASLPATPTTPAQ